MSTIRYEPAIDGLRAIAVLAVMIFHIAPSVLPGGFTGVDVFFVISGFLITRIITSELDSGTFSLVRFYQRRIARIIPPLVVMAVTTLLVACRIYSSQDLSTAGANFSAALLSTANIKLMLQGNYFEANDDALPLLHCWSLSVEEQFYLVFPFILAALYRFSRRVAVLCGILASAVSLAFCIWLTPLTQQWAFYLLPTRAWELIAGALVSRVTLAGRCRALLPLLGIGGLAIVGSAIVATPSSSGFPGPLALWPTLGAVSVLVAATTQPASLAARLLATPWLRTIGMISYSLYLWHWPIFSFVDYSMLFLAVPTRAALKIVLTVAASIVSYAVVEKPARSWLGRPSSPSTGFVFLVTCLVAGVPAGIWIHSYNYLNATPREIAAGGIHVNRTGSDGTVMLLGDSIACMYGTALRDACVAENRRLIVMSIAGQNPLIVTPDDTNPLWQHTLAAVRDVRPEVLVIGCRWDLRLQKQPEFLTLLLGALRPYATKIVLIDAVPKLPQDGTRAAIRAGSRPPFCEPEEEYARREATNRAVAACAGPAVRIIAASGHFSLPGREVVAFDERGRCLYQDRGHVSGWGASLLAEDFRRAIHDVPARPR